MYSFGDEKTYNYCWLKLLNRKLTLQVSEPTNQDSITASKVLKPTNEKKSFNVASLQAIEQNHYLSFCKSTQNAF